MVQVARTVHGAVRGDRTSLLPQDERRDRACTSCCPWAASARTTESRTLGEILARVVEQELPEITTTARMLEDRGGKVYVDYLQNGHGKTIAGAFSARPVPGATCSAPLAWSEVGAKLDPKKFTIKTLPAADETLEGGSAARPS